MNSLQVFRVRWPDDLEMYDVVGESFRAHNVRQAGQYIRANATYLPQRACLVPLDDVPEDSKAVGVFFVQKARTRIGTMEDKAVHVGFLPSEQAKQFRRDMKSLGYEGFCMECAGCVIDNDKTEHPSVRIYVPQKFAALAKKGFLKDPANSPAWLTDGTPVRPRPITNRNGGDYTDDELRKMFSHRAQQRGWNSLPDRAEASLWEFREAGLGLLHFAVEEYAAGTIDL